MRTLFDSMETYSSKTPTISTEMITPQVGDYVVDEMEKILTEIMSITQQCYIDGKGSSYNILKIPSVRELVERFDKVLFDRFGINIETTHCTSTLAAVIPVTAKKWNILNDFAQDLDTYGIQLRGPDADVETVSNKILKEAVDAQKELEKTLGTKSVVFDLNKAKIRGLPNSYRVQVLVNFMMAHEIGLSARNMVAIILHEVGHAWTHLEYSYRNTRNTTVLLDSFLDNYRNKNKTAKESLILSYVEATNDTSAKSLIDKNAPSVALTLSKAYLGHCNQYLTGGYHASIDSENLADGFASRFGLGAELTDALTKAHDKFKPLRYTAVLITSIIVALCVYYAIALLCLGGFFGIFFGTIWFLITAPMVITLYRLIFPGERITETMTYDEIIKRFQRIKNQTVKTLRESDLKKEDMSSILDSIDTLEHMLENAKGKNTEWSGPIESIIRLFNSDKVEIKRLEQLTENLMENNLHIAAAKVKILNS